MGKINTSNAGFLVRDILLIISTLLAAINLWQPPTPWLRQGKIYVSPQGSDWNLGNSPQRAVKTIQRAANMATPGEEVVILPGIYREDLRVRRGGRPNRPITFRAQQPGTVTITNAVPPQVTQYLTWRSHGNGLYSTQTPWPIYYALYNGSVLYDVRWGGIERLKTLVSQPNSYGAFTYDRETKRFYLFLPHGEIPNNQKLVFHREIPSPREWGNSRVANIWLEAQHLVFDGLRLELGVGSSFLLWDSGYITIRNTLLTGAGTGISASPHINVPSHLVVEYNLYHNYPQYNWLKNWLPWNEVYAHYSNSTLISASSPNLVIRHNVVSHGGDALQISPHLDKPGQNGANIYGNLLMYGTDDAIEMDGPAEKVHFHHNLVYDFEQNLGLSPVLTGPVLVENNRFLHPAGGVNGSQVKLLNPWYKPGSPNNQSPIQNIQIRNNTFVGRYLAYWGPPVKNVWVEENLFAVEGMNNPPWHPQVTVRNNTMITLPQEYPHPGTNPQWLQGWSIPRPGPGWLQYEDHPATVDIHKVLSPDLFGSYGSKKNKELR
ncbi:MAG: right-handed parallel beta-helix repeat-containing protein [Sphaerospermopsis kisseleviana]